VAAVASRQVYNSTGIPLMTEMSKVCKKTTCYVGGCRGNKPVPCFLGNLQHTGRLKTLAILCTNNYWRWIIFVGVIWKDNGRTLFEPHYIVCQHCLSAYGLM